MSYTVRCIAPHGTNLRRSVNTLDENSLWLYGEVGKVDDALIGNYSNHTDSFTVLGHDGPLTTGVEVVTGLSAIDVFDGITHQTTFNLSAMALTVTDALAYASKKLFTFTEGRINVLGVTSSLAFAVTTDRTDVTGTINDSASLTYALGSVAASNITLSSTMVDLLPKTTKILDGVAAAYTTVSTAALGAPAAQFDGTTTPQPVYLNVGFETNTQIDHDGILNITGHVTVTWTNLGDY